MLGRRKNRKRVALLRSAAGAFGRLLTGVGLTVRVALVLALVAALPVGIYAGYEELLRSDYFKVDNVEISGNVHLSREDVLSLLALDRPTSIFRLDADQMAERLERNPWVLAALVEKTLPRTLHVTIEERQQAGWLYFDGIQRIDAAGHVIESAPIDEVDGPLLTGFTPAPHDEDAALDDRIGRALSLIDDYAALDLDDWDSLAEVHYDELLGFSLLTRTHHVEIRLGVDRFSERLSRLCDVLSTLEGRDLNGRYILLDAEGSLTRVAVGPVHPGRGGTESAGGQHLAQ